MTESTAINGPSLKMVYTTSSNQVVDAIQDNSKWKIFYILNKIFPMIVKQGVTTSVYIIFAIISVISTLFVFVYFCTLSFINNVDDNPMYAVIFCIAFLFKSIARLLTMYYYYTQFDPNKFWSHLDSNNTTLTNSTIKRLKFWFILACIIFIAQTIRQSVELANGTDTVYQYILFYIDQYFTEIPSIIAQFTVTVILLRSSLNLKQITSKLTANIDVEDDNGNQLISFVDMNEEYKLYIDEFNKEYKLWSVIMIFKTLSILLWYWINVTTFKRSFIDNPVGGIFWFLWNGMLLIEYIYSSNVLTTTYHEFINRLNGFGFEYNMSESNDFCSYLYLLQYASNNKLVATFVQNKEISIKNAVVYTFIFVFCMLVTYQIF